MTGDTMAHQASSASILQQWRMFVTTGNAYALSLAVPSSDGGRQVLDFVDGTTSGHFYEDFDDVTTPMHLYYALLICLLSGGCQNNKINLTVAFCGTKNVTDFVPA